MKNPAVIRNIGFLLCCASVLSPVYLMWQLKEVVTGVIPSDQFDQFYPYKIMGVGTVCLWLGVILFQKSKQKSDSQNKLPF